VPASRVFGHALAQRLLGSGNTVPFGLDGSPRRNWNGKYAMLAPYDLKQQVRLLPALGLSPDFSEDATSFALEVLLDREELCVALIEAELDPPDVIVDAPE